MTSRVRSLFRFTFVAVAAIFNTALSCNGGTVVQVRKCDIQLHDFWPGTFVVTKPTECPIKIPAANYPVNFAEAGSFDPGTLGSFRLTFYDANDQGVTASYNVQIYTLGGTLTAKRDTINVSGTYQAGVAGFGGSQTDRGVNDLEISGSRRLATAVLTYQKLAPASIAAPGIVNPDFDFVVDADLHVANAVPPLAWAWYHNGSFAGATEQLDLE